MTNCKIVSVSSNEPDGGLGNGDETPDGEITGDLTLNLRAERAGRESDRIYTVIVECRDPAGNASQGSVSVMVPHDQKSK